MVQVVAPAADTMVRADEPYPDFGPGVVAAVSMAMQREIRDVPAEWLAFCGHYAGKLWRHEVRGKWQKWLTRAAKDQAETDKRDRERLTRGSVVAAGAYQRASQARADVGYTPPAKGPRRSKFREERAEATPPPLDALAELDEALR